MSEENKMWRVRQLLFPPGSSLKRKLVFPLAFGGLVLILLAAPPIWEYTNSPSFCGTTCHTMPPQYTAYLASPHARVPCVDCHIGRDLLIVQAIRKAGHLRLIVDTVLDSFELPIHTSEMRPARETCEVCHSPETFSDDSLRVINSFSDDRTNDPYTIYLLMHTGGGSARTGLAKGIHWHVQSKITFIALDQDQQEIPWVRVENPDGTVTEYNSINSPIDTSNPSQYQSQTHEMDCIVCHNRIAHLIESPQQLVDTDLASGTIPRDLPFIRARAIELLSATYNVPQQAADAMASLDQYYRDNYPASYKQDEVGSVIAELQKLYADNTYPDQDLTYATHPNNTGHRDWPGCFRCHDGQHFSSDGKVIRMECNLCHSIPLISRPGDVEPKIALATGIEPSSHLDPTWISRHHNVFDASCSNCHTTSNPGGTDNSSFCSNSACHGVNWRYAGFNAPGLATMLGIYQVVPEPILEDFNGQPTYAVLQPLFTQVCGGCHGPVPQKGLRLTDYASLMAGSVDGPVVTPGNPTDSRMIQILTAGHFATLTDHQMGLLRQWIEAGAPEQ
jgi:nitrate/TMAO reductase-like tetraheme cytochrome c subunit